MPAMEGCDGVRGSATSQVIRPIKALAAGWQGRHPRRMALLLVPGKNLSHGIPIDDAETVHISSAFKNSRQIFYTFLACLAIR